MKGVNLGEFEEIVLLSCAILYSEAYGYAITKEITRQTNRQTSISAVHSALNRLERKGFLKSSIDQGNTKRPGKSRRIFTLTKAGKQALSKASRLRDQMWMSIPNWILRSIYGG